jgi:O-methyltransferase involved in polyketide biosynthesis
MVKLSSVNETLFIPLYSKALMSKSNLIIKDKKAEQIIKSISYDFNKLKVAKKIQIFMSLRAVIIDDYTDYFIKNNPDCIVIHLGCGLDSRVMRVKREKKCWYDLDFPQVIELKNNYFSEDENYKMIGSSVTDYNWMSQISYSGEPVLIIAEGLLMYLSETEVKNLLIALKRKFTGSEIIFDAFSKSTVRFSKYQSSLSKTKAKIQWGFNDPGDVEELDAGIKHLHTLYLNDDKRIQSLDVYYKFMFNMTKNIKAAREAQRIFVFKLGRDVLKLKLDE